MREREREKDGDERAKEMEERKREMTSIHFNQYLVDNKGIRKLVSFHRNKNFLHYYIS